MPRPISFPVVFFATAPDVSRNARAKAVAVLQSCAIETVM
jgi:hypothetical protein